MIRETTAFPLVRTKLHQPPVTEDLVPRIRLLRDLRHRRQRPLTVVSAPAGYGKTTLVSHWLEETEWPSAWLSLDEYDNDLVMFLSYFIAAIQTIWPDVGQETQSLLEASTLPPPPVLARVLINELDQIDSPIILVLDDYHVIREATIHELLTELLRYPPRPLHLVITARRDPPLSLSKFRARDQMAEIRSEDLSFTAAETAALLQTMLDEPVAEPTAISLTEKTEGWITGLRLAIRSLQRQGDLDRMLLEMPDNLHYVTEYLLSEVLSNLPPAIRDFLLETSILDRLCGSLCDHLIELDEPVCDGQAYLKWLDETNLFVIPLDVQREWYRYHHLFQQLLKQQLELRYSPDDIAELHRRASGWLAQNGFVEEALRHALAAGDTDTAVSLVAQDRHELMNQDQWRRLDRWLKLFPDDIINQTPPLLISRAWVLYYFWYDLVGTIQVLDRLDELLKNEVESAELRRIAAEGLAIRSQYFYWYADSEAVFSAVQQVLDNTPPAHECVISSAVISQGGAYQLIGDLDNALQTLKSLLQEATFKHTAANTRVLFALCAIYWSAGDLRNLQQTAERLLHLSQQADIGWSRSYGLYYLGLAHYEKNELVEAERYLGQLIENRYLYPMQNVCHGAFPLALIYQAQGQPEKAQAAVQTIADLVQERQNSYFMPLVDVLKVELELRQGQLFNAVHWANQFKLGDLVAPHRFYVPELTVIKALLAEDTPNSLDKATKLLDQMQAHTTSIHANSTLIKLLILQAVAAEKQGSPSTASAHMEQAVRQASREAGYGRFWIPTPSLPTPSANCKYNCFRKVQMLSISGKIWRISRQTID